MGRPLLWRDRGPSLTPPMVLRAWTSAEERHRKTQSVPIHRDSERSHPHDSMLLGHLAPAAWSGTHANVALAGARARAYVRRTPLRTKPNSLAPVRGNANPKMKSSNCCLGFLFTPRLAAHCIHSPRACVQNMFPLFHAHAFGLNSVDWLWIDSGEWAVVHSRPFASVRVLWPVPASVSPPRTPRPLGSPAQ